MFFALPQFVFADPAGSANGSACDLTPGSGAADGLLYNGQCISWNNYSNPPSNTNTNANRPSNTNPSSNITLLNPLNSGECAPNRNCLMNFLNKILEFVIRIGTVVVVLMMVFVGYKFVAARGNPAKIEEARTMLLWTVVGALILLGAQAIAIGIQATVEAIGK